MTRRSPPGALPPGLDLSLPPPPGALAVRLRARYAETDRMGVVYYAHYPVWFEVARSELLRARGVPYARLEEEGTYLPVAELGCRYLAPARYDEEIVVHVWAVEVKSRRILLAYQVRRAGTLLATGFTWHVATDREGRVLQLPAALRQALAADQAAGAAPPPAPPPPA